MKTLLIHVGMGRAGTSALQKFLALNRDALMTRGWAYPDETAFGLPARGSSVGNLTSLALLAREGQAIDEPLAQFSAYLGSGQTDHVLVSSEWTMGTGEVLLAPLRLAAERAGFSAKAIIYFREQCEWLLSDYAQKLKTQNWTLTAEECMQQALHGRNLNYYAKFLRLTRLFDKERVQARIYDRAKLVGGDIQSDFLSVMQVDGDGLQRVDASVNASADMVEVELMRLINRNEASGLKIDKNRLLQLASEIPGDRDHRLYRLVSPASIQGVRERYRRSNKRLQNELQLPAPLFNLRIPSDYETMDEACLISERSVQILLRYLETVRQAPDHKPLKPSAVQATN
ncbi:hypothetical protein [Hydrocarboniphaga sp.]|uniref:hypothetical protein n=1 Tax=Hydrocarboniphaga sp. TaxID=2033016 RepID=UPI003D113C64